MDSGETLGLQIKKTTSGAVNVSSTPSRAERVGELAGDAIESGEEVAPEEREAALREIARAPSLMQPFLRRAILDPDGFKRGILETFPRMLFLLLPVFAGIVAIFYRGRKYPEHLYFAIHLHSFIFLALGVAAVLRFTRIPFLAVAGSVIGLVWVPVYATLAFRRVYGGSLGRTIFKEAGIAAIYFVVSAVGFAVMIFWVSIAT
jgi:hypothetical protein